MSARLAVNSVVHCATAQPASCCVLTSEVAIATRAGVRYVDLETDRGVGRRAAARPAHLDAALAHPWAVSRQNEHLRLDDGRFSGFSWDCTPDWISPGS